MPPLWNQGRRRRAEERGAGAKDTRIACSGYRIVEKVSQRGGGERDSPRHRCEKMRRLLRTKQPSLRRARRRQVALPTSARAARHGGSIVFIRPPGLAGLLPLLIDESALVMDTIRTCCSSARLEYQ
jgi:hypothetical protein